MRRPPAWSRWFGVALFLLSVVPPGRSRADEPRPTEDPRIKLLKSRAERWIDAEKTFYLPCATCDGRGTVTRQMSGGGALSYVCPRCNGQKTLVNRPSFYWLYYDAMSRAWQQQKGDRAQMEAVAKAMDEGKGRPAKITTGVLVRVEPVGERFGIAYVKVNGEDRERKVQWVWAVPPDVVKGTWWLYGGEVDGRWAEEGCAAEPGGKRPLQGKEIEAVDAALAGLALHHAVIEKARAGDGLLLALEIQGPHKPEDLATAVRDDAIALVRACFGNSKDWQGVRLTFSAEWLDKFGRVSVKPHVHVCLRRDAFEKIVFENLKPDQVLALFTMERRTYPDLALRAP